MAVIINPKETDAVCFALVAKELITKKDGGMLTFQDMVYLKGLYPEADFFEEEAYNYCTLEYKGELPEGYQTKAIRSFFAENEPDLNLKLSRARSLLAWRRDNKYCSFCGSPIVDHAVQTARECPQCKKVYFPRIEPCIIVLVSKGDKILLVKHIQRNQDVYACIAGFIEVGESAEHAVRREIEEEVGIQVKNIQYRGTQSWPFPDQLMIAFTAEYASGEFKLQPDEIADAQWFDRDNCPATPPAGSIAYKLIWGEI
ncbi:MAG: NAD(+) diphosphatase [Paludibacteraceae bacterium]|nr:NAD(+) diphosphatase [Paludibacteraceae bacterium]